MGFTETLSHLHINTWIIPILPMFVKRQLDKGNRTTIFFSTPRPDTAEDNREVEPGDDGQCWAQKKKSVGFWTRYNCKRTSLLSLHSASLGKSFWL